MNCRANGSYPTTDTGCCDLCYAKLLSKDYCGPDSELTAITQYLYQHFILKNCFPDTADLLECIAKAEMTHFELLGELIVNFGGDPIIGASQGPLFSYWTGKNVSNEKCVEKILCEDIRSEKVAIQTYRERKCQICNRNAQAVLDRIILDEQCHLELLENELRKYCCGPIY